MSWELEDEDEVVVGRVWDIDARARSLFVLEVVIVGGLELVEGKGGQFTGRTVHCLVLTWVHPKKHLARTGNSADASSRQIRSFASSSRFYFLSKTLDIALPALFLHYRLVQRTNVSSSSEDAFGEPRDAKRVLRAATKPVILFFYRERGRFG